VDRAAKIRFLKGLDVLSVPSRYVEPKGLYLLEALANGVPVVQPRHGSFPEIIEATGGGLLFEPGNAGALAEAILSLWKDPARAVEMGQRGARGVREHYSVARMADRALEVYTGTVARPARVAAAS
jgi:glycosyltransferase involved in cell wall biosynthesis